MKLSVIALTILLMLMGCGKATFTAKGSSSDITIPVAATTTNYYMEFGDSFPNQVQGEVTLTSARFSALAKWPGLSSLEFELRLSTTGAAQEGETRFTLSAPSSWAQAYPVINSTIPASASQYSLSGTDITAFVAPILQQGGKFWIQVRVRSTGLDLNKSLELTKIQVQAEGSVDLSPLSPLVNLTF